MNDDIRRVVADGIGSTPPNQRLLRQLQDELRDVTRDLTEVRTLTELGEDGHLVTHQAPSLLDMLRESVAHGGETGQARGGRNGTPVRIDSLDLITQIEQDSTVLHQAALAKAHSDPVEHIRAAAAIAGRWTEPDAVAALVRYYRSWAIAIRALLDPPRRLHIAAACPACDVRMVWRRDDTTGEDVQTPALTVDGVKGCVCLACGHNWPPANLEHLAKVLGYDPVTGTTP